MRKISQVSGVLLVLGALAAPVAASAQTPVTWELVDEYPETAIPGQADLYFAQAVATATQGAVVIAPIAGAKSGLRSKDQVAAVKDGKFAMANSFGGALSGESPVFLLSSLPFVAASADDSRKLYDTAKPLYDKLFAERGQKLLFVTPWPPSGIWAAKPVDSVAALKALKIRTYDETGTEMFNAAGAKASVVSYADLTPKLESGEINAVLSSGDGGAGRKLWTYLPNFSEIVYAVPLSFGTVSLDKWKALPAPTQAAIEKAGADTTAHQWEVLKTRVAENYVRMRENGVTIDEHPPQPVMQELGAAAKSTLSAWKTTAGPDAAKILDDFLARK